MLDPSTDSRPIYTIDARDRIMTVNTAWIRFMYPQDDTEAALQSVIGRSVWELTPGGRVHHLRQLWQVLYERVRGIGTQAFVPMRVDTLTERRLIDIELRPLADRAIQHICERIWTEARLPVALLDPVHPRDARTLRHCAWCCRIQVRVGVWEEVEEAQEALAIATHETVPTLVAAACSGCKQAVLKTFPLRVA